MQEFVFVDFDVQCLLIIKIIAETYKVLIFSQALYKGFTYIVQKTYEIGAIIPILQLRKQSHGQIQYLCPATDLEIKPKQTDSWLVLLN